MGHLLTDYVTRTVVLILVFCKDHLPDGRPRVKDSDACGAHDARGA